MATQTLEPHEEEDEIIDKFVEHLSCSSNTTPSPPAPPYTLFGPSLFSFSIYDFLEHQNLKVGYNPEDLLVDCSCDLSISFFNLAKATMMGNKLASPEVHGEVDPDNKTMIGYLRYCKEWSEQQIQILLEGTKDPSLLDELTGFDIVYLSKNQLGFQYLQGIVNVETTETILCRVANANRVLDLLSDHYGSYLFQRLLLSCTNKAQLDRIVCALVDGDLSKLICMATTFFGSLSIKKLFQALTRLKSPLVSDLISVMEPGLFLLMKDACSSHVIIGCLKTLSYDQNQAIYNAAVNNCTELAEHAEGYQVMMIVIEKIQEPCRMQLLKKLAVHSVNLAQSSYGNLVLQKVIELDNPRITEDISQNLKPYVVELSMHKHGNHFIEKCLETTGMEYFGLELLQSDQLPQVARDQYGNYILHKVLKRSKIRFQYYWMHRAKLALGLIPNYGNASNNVLKCLENVEQALLGDTYYICKRH